MKGNGIIAFEGSSVIGPLDGIFGLMCAERKLCPRCYKELSVYPQMPILLEGCLRGALRVWAEWFHRSSLVVRNAGAYLCLTCIVSSEAFQAICDPKNRKHANKATVFDDDNCKIPELRDGWPRHQLPRWVQWSSR